MLLDHVRVVAGHHENAGHAFKRLGERGPISQLGDDRFCVLAQNLTGFVGVANDANRSVPELLELFDNGAACIAGRTNDGNHGVLPRSFAVVLQIPRAKPSSNRLGQTMRASTARGSAEDGRHAR